jgi:hypothetical protein
MKLFVLLAAVLCLGSVAFADCPGGVCPIQRSRSVQRSTVIHKPQVVQQSQPVVQHSVRTHSVVVQQQCPQQRPMRRGLFGFARRH